MVWVRGWPRTDRIKEINSEDIQSGLAIMDLYNKVSVTARPEFELFHHMVGDTFNQGTRKLLEGL